MFFFRKVGRESHPRCEQVTLGVVNCLAAALAHDTVYVTLLPQPLGGKPLYRPSARLRPLRERLGSGQIIFELN